MAKAKNDALQRLLERNFGDPAAVKKKSKLEKRAVRKRREEIKKIKASTPKPKQKAAKKKSTALDDEIDALRQEIAKDIDTKPTYVKRQYRDEAPAGWEGLTPGLAPVGFDPDESDSDEDPY